ncbi:hypothetical protein C8Q73DRAFT_160678 [Cubamyces lactineus]|nr:hypothetical protein C8Q73DRAFT_160678 [Cubamyces lactineus]
MRLGPAAFLQQVSIAPCPRPSSGGNNVAPSMNAHEAAHGRLGTLPLPFHFAGAKQEAFRASAISWLPSYRSLARGVHRLLRTSLPSSHFRWHNRQAGLRCGNAPRHTKWCERHAPILALQMVLMDRLAAFELPGSPHSRATDRERSRRCTMFPNCAN